MFKRKKGKKSSSDGLFEQDVFVAPDRNKPQRQQEQPPVYRNQGYEDDYDVQPSTRSKQQEQPRYQNQQRVTAKWQRKEQPPVYKEEPQQHRGEPLYQKPQRPSNNEPRKPLYAKNQPVSPTVEEDKAELNQYFEQNKKQSKKLKKQKKQTKKQPKRSKKEEKRQLEMDLYEGRAFQFRDKVFRSVDEFIEYLQKKYLQIDKIAKEVFENEKFYAWLKTHSYNFDASLVVFEELQRKIEN